MELLEGGGGGDLVSKKSLEGSLQFINICICPTFSTDIAFLNQTNKITGSSSCAKMADPLTTTLGSASLSHFDIFWAYAYEA